MVVLLSLLVLGLSPLARGNRIEAFRQKQAEGPIPARTGQPCPGQARVSTERAYPRSHGATSPVATKLAAPMGLSPLARGNRHAGAGHLLKHGPIPARTGQPQSHRPFPSPMRAYPRSHGATRINQLDNIARLGLSPLARGNHRQDLAHKDSEGPIPARTGQPGRLLIWLLRRRAYPRSHGATVQQGYMRARMGGLSPLARGNQKPKVGNL